MSKTNHAPNKGSLLSYMWGFLLSLFLTLGAYIPVYLHESSRHELFSHEFLYPYVLIFAVIQLFVQSFFFLHVFFENRPQFRLVFFVSTLGVVFMVVAGSIWIMNNLTHRMNPQSVQNHIVNDEQFHHE